MGMHEAQKYLVMRQLLDEGTDTAIQKQVVVQMNQLWYYYLTPTDKKYINQQLGENRTPQRENSVQCNSFAAGILSIQC